MKKHTVAFWITLLMLVAAALILHASTAAALPEYSAQTGEPCATCHLSPSGGGPRGARGQAWVGGGKPGAVPDLVQALEMLGIRLEVDETRFALPTADPAAAEAPVAAPDPAAAEKLRRQLNAYDGN